jgi:hypothetical protein
MAQAFPFVASAGAMPPSAYDLESLEAQDDRSIEWPGTEWPSQAQAGSPPQGEERTDFTIGPEGGYLPQSPAVGPPPLTLAPSGARAFLEARQKLISASESDLRQGYAAQLDKVVILGYQAARQSPDDPAVWRLLGRLSETKSLFAANAEERQRLMEEARSHFEKSAALERSRKAMDQAEVAPANPPAYSDPYLNELFWTGRLRRGEVTLANLERRYAVENLQPLHRPELWRDRLYLINQGGQGLDSQELARAREDFEGLWAQMPVEVPWPGPVERFGPAKLKKVEVLEAWALTLTALSEGQEGEVREELFQEALDLYPRALVLALDRFEIAALIGQLDRADALAPNPEALQALWAVKDLFFDLWIKNADKDPEAHLAWAKESLQRARRQDDGRIFKYYLEESGRKFDRYAALSQQSVAAFLDWGRLLEAEADFLSGASNFSDPEEKSARVRQLIDLATEKYRRAYELEPLRPACARSLGRILLKTAALGPEDTFDTTSEESRRYASLAINADPDTAEAWFIRGVDLLEAGRLAPSPARVSDRLVAEAMTAFRQYLRANNNRTDHLRVMADNIWRAAESSPSHRVAALTVLSDVCSRLIALNPAEADYHFARSLTLYSLLAATPDWPDDWNFSESDYAKTSFAVALASFRDGLELLSRSGLPSIRPWETYGLAPGPAADANFPFTGSLDLLRGAGSPGASLRLATFQERLATILNRQLERLLSAMRPETLPPWYKLRLASFFRRVGSTGYPPPEDQMAFYRLAEILLNEAEAEYHSPADPALGRSRFASILSEKGLLMAEMSLVAQADVDFLLSEAEKFWTGAEAASPGASRYALARWSAWSGNVELLKPLLSHTAEQQDHYLWPTFQEAAYEPSLAPFYGESWFKNAWFGYSR